MLSEPTADMSETDFFFIDIYNISEGLLIRYIYKKTLFTSANESENEWK